MSKYSNIRVDKRTTFTTLDGIEIHFAPFSWDEYQLSLAGLKDEYRARGEVIDCPQYDVKMASGAIEKFDHDAKSILQAPPGTPDEDKQAIIDAQVALWEQYQDAQKRFAAEDNEIMSSYVYDEALASVVLPEDTAWEMRQAKRHIAIPTDLEEKRLHYINTVLLKSKADQIDLISTIAAVSMGVVKEADLQAVRDSFRDNIFGGFAKLIGNSFIQAQDTAHEQMEE
jgi:hypothetical protein